MSDLFAPYATPAPPDGLKSRVLTAIASDRSTPRFLSLLDTLWSSRVWWLGWGVSVVILGVLMGAPGRAGEGEDFTAETWRRYRASVAPTLGSGEANEGTGSSQGGSSSAGGAA